MNVIIKAENVDHWYGEDDNRTRALKDISLEIDEGSFVAVLGHNGSGKSTLAKHFNAILTPELGKIYVAGMDTSDKDLVIDIRRTVGMVFQNPDNQMVASIIEDDVAFGPENLGVPREEIRERVDEALKTVGMYEHRTRTPFKLSGGQKQRVAIAAILAMRPEILILDESTAMLDPEGRSEVMETIKRLNKDKNVTVILITHYMDEALNADKVFVLNRGSLIAQGDPREVFSDLKAIKKAKLELPVAAAVSHKLIAAGIDVPVALTDEELAEAICRSK